MTSNGLRNWVKHTLGLDRAIVFTVLARVWSSASGIVTVLLIARFLSPAEQGYYYTFGSLVALQIVFELGFSIVILQLASHERAHLVISADGAITGDAIAHQRLASVLQKAVRWYFTGALLMAAVLIPWGFYFFTTHQHAQHSLSWQIPWILVVLAASLTFQIDPILSFLEGCGFVANVARLRLAQAMLSGLMAWVVLAAGHGLFAPAMMIFGQAIAGAVWLNRRRPLLLGLLRHKSGSHAVKWKSEVWPFQWRVAVTWICAYFVYQLFNPVLFAYRGAVEAGRMGMSLSIMGALTSVSIAWVNTKAAPFGTLIARKEYAELDRVFFSALRQCMFICTFGSVCVWLGAVYLNARHLRFAERILDPLTLGMLLLGTVINVLIFALSIYLRAHKEEKMLGSSILGATLVGCSTYFLGRHFGARGMVIGYLAVQAFVGLGYNLSIFTEYRREAHR
ncbi:hypothetical protein ACPOL_2198 [Acidisarcina polymorpha]|uniref:Polysaccharide biosynthesis protein n=1 Tax=Acidisarcina polymorpha TaxID=2211140 RepID=A0A2Z5FXK4_9BACT|nr:hypothetical protein [Acidisarcina polymorpha]AXC11522.1 hypothetical protein ACPOL_2198 [Acidisarcina polymorpha]